VIEELLCQVGCIKMQVSYLLYASGRLVCRKNKDIQDILTTIHIRRPNGREASISIKQLSRHYIIRLSLAISNKVGDSCALVSLWYTNSALTFLGANSNRMFDFANLARVIV